MKYLVIAILALPCRAFATEPAPPQVAGTWAQLQVQTSIASVPIAGEVVSQTVALLHVVIEQDEKRLKVRSTPCRVQIDSEINIVRTIIPPAMVKAMGTQEFKARLKYADSSWVYYQPPAMQTLGVSLKNKWRDKMPTDASDERVFDADADGKPGVTVRIEGIIDGAVYVAQRSWSRLEGIITKGRIKGSLTWQTDQFILDASSAMLSESPKTRPSLLPSENYFRAVQVDPKATCKEILKMSRKSFEF